MNPIATKCPTHQSCPRGWGLLFLKTKKIWLKCPWHCNSCTFYAQLFCVFIAPYLFCLMWRAATFWDLISVGFFLVKGLSQLRGRGLTSVSVPCAEEDDDWVQGEETSEYNSAARGQNRNTGTGSFCSQEVNNILLISFYHLISNAS